MLSQLLLFACVCTFVRITDSFVPTCLARPSHRTVVEMAGTGFNRRPAPSQGAGNTSLFSPNTPSHFIDMYMIREDHLEVIE